MSLQTVIDNFRTLFEGRPNAYGTEEGGCVRSKPNFTEHLSGDCEPIGIYPMWPSAVYDGHPARDPVDVDWLCLWGCIDIDEDNLPLATLLQRCLAAMNVTAWIEVSRSKGYHVWVFAEEAVMCSTMRRALLAACETVEYTPKEVNPKAERFDDVDKLGNYVRLPYPGALHMAFACVGVGLYPPLPEQPSTRRVIIDSGGNIFPIDLFVELALECRTPVATLQKWAATWHPPVRHHVQLSAPTEDATVLAAKLPPLARKIWREGPLDGRDRSNTLHRLAYLMNETSPLTPSEAVVIMVDADRRWGKFVDRGEVEQLHLMVERAYGR